MTLGDAIRGSGALAMRELMRTWRQPTRVIAAVGTPLLMWLLLASGLSRSVRIEGAGAAYSAYLYPGMIALTAIFAGIFAAMSLIEDRHSGVLQAAITSPLPRWALALSKIAGGGAAGMAQVALMIALSPLLGASADPVRMISALAWAGALCAAVTGLCLALAWFVDSASGFHGVMNLLLMPMWLLSGAFYPVEQAGDWIRLVTRANPLSAFLAMLRSSMLDGAHAIGWAEPIYAILCTLLAFGIAWATIGRRG